MSRNMNKLHLNILDAFSYRKQLFELLEYSYNQRLYIYILFIAELQIDNPP